MAEIKYDFIRLLDVNGSEIAEPIAAGVVELSYDSCAGVAQVFEGRTCIATLNDARIAWIQKAGIRIHGVEKNGNKLKHQRWHLKPRDND